MAVCAARGVIADGVWAASGAELLGVSVWAGVAALLPESEPPQALKAPRPNPKTKARATARSGLSKTALMTRVRDL